MDELNERLKKLEEYVTHHEEDIKNNRIGISSNSQRIDSNTGALALLHTINSNSNKYFVIWELTFIALLLSAVFNIYLLTQYNKVETIETQEVEQDTDDGSNYYIGRDGDINGYTED